MKLGNIAVTIELTEPILGTVPKNKKLYEDFIASKAETTEDAEEEIETVEELDEKSSTGFHSDDNGFFVYDYLIRGFLKHAGNVLKDQLYNNSTKKPGIQALKSKINSFLFVKERRIYFNKQKVDDSFVRTLRAMTPMGPRTFLAKADIFNAGTRLTFNLQLLSHKELKVETVKEILSYGELQGLGQWRSGGYGRFKVIKFEATPEPTHKGNGKAS